MHKANFDLVLEIVSLVLFFIFLGVLVIVAVATFTIVGIEVEDEEPSVLEAIAYTPQGYLLLFLILTVPAVVVILAGLGIKALFRRL